MKICYLSFLLIVAGLPSTQAYSHTSKLLKYFLLQHSSNAGRIENIPLPQHSSGFSAADPIIYNTSQNHLFTITSQPDSPATTITLLFNGHVQLFTFESGISVDVNRINDNKYQVEIHLPATQQKRTRAFTLLGTSTLEIEKSRFDDPIQQLKLLLYTPQHTPQHNGDTFKKLSKQWEHTLSYEGHLKANLYTEQKEWLRHPTPSTTLIMMFKSCPKNTDQRMNRANPTDNTEGEPNSGERNVRRAIRHENEKFLTDFFLDCLECPKCKTKGQNTKQMKVKKDECNELCFEPFICLVCNPDHTKKNNPHKKDDSDDPSGSQASMVK